MPQFDSVSLLGLCAALLQLVIIIGVILRVMLTRHPPGSSFAWILITTILPYVGFILYLLFGERPIGQLRARRFREALSQWQTLSRHKLTPTGPLPVHLAPHRTLIHLAVRMAHLPVTSGSTLKLLSRTRDMFESIIADLDAAEKSVDMEFYIWSEGGEADHVRDALLRARARGVRVRILVDDFGSRAFLRSDSKRLLAGAGVSIAAAMPMKFLRFFGLQRGDLRLHRKTIIIDGKIGYTGSLNMIDPESYDAAKTVGAWVDAMVRLEGPAVRTLESMFLNDWALQPDGDLSDLEEIVESTCIDQPGSATVVTVPSGPYGMRDSNLFLLLDSINAARFSLTITTPYFVPNEVLATALLNAAHRGVEVTLIIPAEADSRTVSWAARRYFDDLLGANIRILLYHGGLLHTKSVAVDDEYALFGTVNFDNRSLHLNFEMMLLIFDPAFMADIKKLHLLYESKCSRVDAAAWKKRPLLDRLKEGASYLVSPLL